MCLIVGQTKYISINETEGAAIGSLFYIPIKFSNLFIRSINFNCNYVETYPIQVCDEYYGTKHVII